MLSDQEVNEIILELKAMDQWDSEAQVRFVYQKGYEQAVADINRLEENGVLVL